MELFPTNLVGEAKTTEATFIPLESSEIVDLTQSKVKITFTENGKDCQLSYPDATNEYKCITTGLEENIAHFSPVTELNTQGDPLKVPFTILPGKEVNSIAVQFELLDQENRVLKTYTVTWEKTAVNKPVDLILTNSTNLQLKGNEPFILHIQNKGIQPSEPGKLKLKIKRTHGEQATIVGSILKGSTYELDLEDSIPANDTGITKMLTIHPGIDNQATFTFQLIYIEGSEEKTMGEPITVSWELSNQPLLKDIFYDKTTGNIFYTIANEGTESIQGLKLHYVTKDQGVTIDEEPLTATQELGIGELTAETAIVSKKLGKLNLGPNEQVTFDFWLSYTGNPTEHARQSKVFRAADIQLAINELYYDLGSNHIIYNIQNNGKDPAQHVILRYTNISTDQAGKSILVGNKQEDTINLGDIDGESLTGDQTLEVDFKSATKATFQFELLYEGILIDKEDIEVKLPKLKLIPDAATFLIGANRKIQFKIEELDGLDIDPSEVKILITKQSDAAIKLYHKQVEVNGELLGNDLADISRPIQILIEPGTATKAEIHLQVIYKDRVMEDSETFIWEVDLNNLSKLLFKAIRSGNFLEVKRLLQCEQTQVNATDEYGESPLSLAIKNGDIASIEQLVLCEQTQVNATNEHGETPLWLAALSSNEKAMLALLRSPNINVNIKGSGMLSSYTLLHSAVQQGNKAMIDALLTKGAYVNAKSEDGTGYTPLHWAVFDCNQGTIERLLQAPGIDPNAIDKCGDTPLHLAVRKGNTATMEQLLLAPGIDVNALGNYRDTPLHVAIRGGHLEAMKLLLLAPGIDINALGNYGDTPLHVAIRGGHLEAMKLLLLDQRINVDSQNNLGDTPLHCAIIQMDEDKGDESMAQLLFKKGANLAIKNNEGETPSDVFLRLHQKQ